MEDELHPALLPAGMRDTLPPHAAIEADLVEGLIRTLDAHGYERVKPPLVEFETSLLGGPGAAMAQETFRLMDPASHRMICVRADMTLQIARIATSRLTNAPRPLRLCYAGEVLRVRGSELRPERQFGQIGAELIGCDLPAADAEVITLAAEALLTAGVEGLSVDLNLPTMLPALLASFIINERDATRLRGAVDQKDAAQLAQHGGEAAPLLLSLLSAAGPAPVALAKLRELALPSGIKAEIDYLAEAVRGIEAALPGLMVTIDPIENRGFEYHSGISFTLFARGARNELGRGGRYRAAEEGSTGFTLYADAILGSVPKPAARRRVYLPRLLPRDIGTRLRAEGWISVAALDDADPQDEAARLGCSHLATAKEPVAL